MPFGLPSELAPVAFLSILLAAAVLLSLRYGSPSVAAPRVVPAACLNLALQALHVAEEFSTGFHRQAPAMLGLEPWSPSFFVWINLTAVALWTLALRACTLGRVNPFWAALLWFLAIASIGNALWHPLVSLAIRQYFPGTVSAPFLGIAGFLLARAMLDTEERPLEARP